MYYFNAVSKTTVSVSLAVLLFAAGAHAQVEVDEQGAAASAAENVEATRRLGAITVTAQKREQSLQDVPIVVTALSGELLSDAGVQDIKDLTVVTPGLLVTSSSKQANTTARIRGIGTVGDNPGLESSVGVVIDGVPRARNGVSFGDLGEIERIEVLKGPQGTLFGKSTSAGVINVITKKPSDELESIFEVGIGNEGFLRTSAEVTGPLSKTVSGRLFGVYEERGGLLDVKTGNGPRTEDETSQYDFYSVRGQLRFEPSSDLEILLSADYTDREEDCCMGDYIAVDPARGPLITLLAGGDGASAFPIDPFDRVAFANRDATQTTEDWGVSANIEWQSGLGELTSITSYRDWENGSGQDTGTLLPHSAKSYDSRARPITSTGRWVCFTRMKLLIVQISLLTAMITFSTFSNCCSVRVVVRLICLRCQVISIRARQMQPQTFMNKLRIHTPSSRTIRSA